LISSNTIIIASPEEGYEAADKSFFVGANMNPILQWAIPIVIGILTFFAGRSFERHKLAQANRLKLLEPVEEWVNNTSRFVGIIGDDVSAVGAGLQHPIIYNPDDRRSVGKSLSENKERVLGVLKSNVLNTRSTRKISKRLSGLVDQLTSLIERDLIQADVRLLDKMNQNRDPSTEMMLLVETTSKVNNIIREIHICLSQLKVKFN
jgi:hypothetical protein